MPRLFLSDPPVPGGPPVRYDVSVFSAYFFSAYFFSAYFFSAYFFSAYVFGVYFFGDSVFAFSVFELSNFAQLSMNLSIHASNSPAI
jgi:hypothetical protein